jgi:hypothetical protein
MFKNVARPTGYNKRRRRRLFYLLEHLKVGSLAGL